MVRQSQHPSGPGSNCQDETHTGVTTPDDLTSGAVLATDIPPHEGDLPWSRGETSEVGPRTTPFRGPGSRSSVSAEVAGTEDQSRRVRVTGLLLG